MALCTACPVSTLRVVGAGEGAEHGKGAVVLPLGGGRWGVHWSPRHNAEGRGCWGLYLQLCTHPGSTPPPTPSLPPISSSLCPPSHRISLSLSPSLLSPSSPPPTSCVNTHSQGETKRRSRFCGRPSASSASIGASRHGRGL